MSERFDVAVVGGGIAGATFAAILGDAGLKIALIERQPPAALEGSAYDGRTTAITYGSRKMLEAAGLWAGLAPHACPIDDIRVADNASPMFLHFDSREVGDDPLGSIVENRLIRIALRQRIDEIANVSQISPATVSGLDTEGEAACVTLADGRVITADLVIGADGRESFIRGAAGIKTVGWKYKQQAIVTIMGHELDHENVAVENFLPPGPFAMLPMVDAPDGTHRSSIVWTDHLDAVPLYIKLDKAAFDAELQTRAGEWLGKVWDIGPRFTFPLSLRHATRYVARRVALIADAAHVIHPIAGQGLNLGMRDIGLLSELLIDQRRLGLDLGDPMLLARYQAKRRGDNFAFSAATDILDRLFSNDIPPIRAARRIGLGTVNQVPPLRRFFMRRAMGAAGALSRLGRGGEGLIFRLSPIRKIRIVQPPLGEAPPWVREAWVGLELTIIPGLRPYLTVGVVTGPKTFLGQSWAALTGKAKWVVGYPVYSADAIELLAIKNPRAAEWWRTNTPQFLRSRKIFVFDEPACIQIRDDKSTEALKAELQMDRTQEKV